MDKLWWTQIPRANAFLRTIINTLLDGKSAILHMPNCVPWQQTLYDLVTEELSYENPAYKMEFFSCPEEDVGEYLVSHYCRKELRATLRRGISHAQFLAKLQGTVLNSRYLWVQNVSPERLQDWGQFITEYNQNLPANQSPALFLLEVRGECNQRRSFKGICDIFYRKEIASYDCFAFCTLASTAQDGMPSHLRAYFTELVFTLCGHDLELCAACIQYKMALLHNPEVCLQEIVQQEAHSDGTAFDIFRPLSRLQELLWKCQIRCVYPILQQYQSKFIQEHYKEISASLPITNAYEQVIDDPQDMELGQLVRLVGLRAISLTGHDEEQLKLFRDARNSLAHMKPIDFQSVDALLSVHLIE